MKKVMKILLDYKSQNSSSNGKRFLNTGFKDREVLSQEASMQDVENLFKKYGKIVKNNGRKNAYSN